MYWINLNQDRDWWWTLENVVINPQVPKNAEKLASLRSIHF